MRFPKVTFFIISFNQENYIKECLDSILIQEYPNLEIVVGDDASTDNTKKILIGYKEKYQNIFKLSFNKENLGITKNCNKTLKLCKGKYIFFIGGDDVCFPGKIQKQVNYMEENNDCVLCYHNAEVFYSEEPEKKNYLYYDKCSSKGDVGSIVNSNPIFICPVSTIIRKTAIPSKGFNEIIPKISDRLFFFEIALKGKLGFIDDVLMRYRKRKDGSSRKIAYSERFQLAFIIEQKYPKYWIYSNRLYGDIYHKLAERFYKKGSFKLVLLYSIRSILKGSGFNKNINLIFESIKSKIKNILKI